MRFVLAMSVVVALALLFREASGAHQDDVQQDGEKIRGYLAAEYDGIVELPNGGAVRGLAFNDTATLKAVEIPELKTFLPKTRFFVTALDSPFFEYNPVEVAVCITPQESGHDIRNCLSPVFTTASPKFLSLFRGLPTKSAVERKQLASGLGKLLAAVTLKGDVRALKVEPGTATIELWHGDLHWRNIELTFDQDGTCQSLLIHNPKTKPASR